MLQAIQWSNVCVFGREAPRTATLPTLEAGTPEPRPQPGVPASSTSTEGTRAAGHASYTTLTMKLLSLVAAGLGSLAAAAASSSANAVSLPPTFAPPQVFQNANLVHVISLEKNYVKDTINIKVENIATEPQDEYYLPFTADQMSRVGGVEVKDRKDAELAPFEVTAVDYSDEAYGRPLFTSSHLPLTLQLQLTSLCPVIPSTIKSGSPNLSPPEPSGPSASPSTTPRAMARSPPR